LGGVAIVDAASFLVAAAMIAAIGTPARPARSPSLDAEASGTRAAIWQEWLAGLRMVWERPVVRIVFGVFAIASIGEGVMQTAFWIYVDQALGGGAREAGWLMSAQAIGGFVGAAMIGSWGKARPPVLLLAWGSIGIGLCDLMLFNYPAFVSGIGLGLLFMGLAGLPATAFGTGYISALQAEAGDAYRGRVFGALLATSALFMIIGAAFAGLATERLGAVAILTIDAVGYIAAGAFALAAVSGYATRRRRGAERLLIDRAVR
jgi:Na+/melibiose symporter-like transporter